MFDVLMVNERCLLLHPQLGIDTASRFAVRGFPTLKLLRNGDYSVIMFNTLMLHIR